MKKIRLKYKKIEDTFYIEACFDIVLAKTVRKFLIDNIMKFTIPQDFEGNISNLESSDDPVFFCVQRELNIIEELVKKYNQDVDFNNKFKDMINE